MKYELMNLDINSWFSIQETIMHNRGIKFSEMERFLHPGDDVISSPDKLGIDLLDKAVNRIMDAIDYDQDVVVVVDADTDGFTSAAIIINYLTDVNPEWSHNHLKYFLHKEKTHGILDAFDYIKNFNPALVVIPDASSSEGKLHNALKESGIDCIVMDHHPINDPDQESKAIIINNQTSDFENKDLSGAGITWEVCRWYDSKTGYKYADNYLDLVALGCVADMMDLSNIETRKIISIGLKNIRNPFFLGLVEKNEYSIKNVINPTPTAIAFYVAPYINSITRMGTLEEKDIVFRSMLKHEAYKKVPSTKRGHKLGDEESVLAQALRTVVNVKNRQKKAQDLAMKEIVQNIEDNHLDENKVILVTLPDGAIEKNLAGLVANKIAAEYSKPTCILSEKKNGVFSGSARGCAKTGVTEFKSMCEDTDEVIYTGGHQAAFGISLPKDGLSSFIEKMNEELKDVTDESVYKVDVIYPGNKINEDDVLSVAEMKYLWGAGFPEPLIAFTRVKVDLNRDTNIYRNKTNTIKISLGSGVEMIKFRATDEDINIFEGFKQNDVYIDENGKEKNIYIDVVGRCDENIWKGMKTAQIIIEDYEVVKEPIF